MQLFIYMVRYYYFFNYKEKSELQDAKSEKNHNVIRNKIYSFVSIGLFQEHL